MTMTLEQFFDSLRPSEPEKPEEIPAAYPEVRDGSPYYEDSLAGPRDPRGAFKTWFSDAWARKNS